MVDTTSRNRYNNSIKMGAELHMESAENGGNIMSSFQDLYAHAAADRSRALQFAVIKDIRRRAVREMMDDGVYIEPENPDEMTEEEHNARQVESAYAYGLRSIIDVRVLEEEDGNPAYATAVRNSATKPYCITLCLQTKLEELTVRIRCFMLSSQTTTPPR